MSFTGESILQATQISGAGTRLTAVEAALPTKVDNTTYTTFVNAANARYAGFDAQDLSHTNSITNLQNNKVDVSTYDAKVALLDAADGTHDSRLTAVETLSNSKVSTSDYNTQVAALEAADSALEGRATALEGRATTLEADVAAIETDIAGRVESAINARVTTITFDALAAELRNVDSELSTTLATKVATTVQQQTDEAQNALINSKVAQTAYDTKMTALDAKDAALTTRDYYFESRLLAIDEFIKTMLGTYSITKPNGQAYTYTASWQNLATATPFTVLGKRNANGAVVIQFNASSYRTFLGDVIMRTNPATSNKTVSTVVRGNVNPTTFIVDLVPSSALITTDFDISISLRDTNLASFFGVQLTLTQYQNLAGLA